MNKIKIISLLITLTVLAGACGKMPRGHNTVKIDPYYITGSRENREHLRELFTLLAREDNLPESTFAVIREIANSFARAKEYGRLIHFLSGGQSIFPMIPTIATIY